MRLISSSRPPWATRNRIDSGTKTTTAATTVNDRTPPARNSTCHPNTGIKTAAIGPGKMKPIGTPSPTTTTKRPRHRAGAASAARAMTLEMTPPSPTPARKRSNAKDVRE